MGEVLPCINQTIESCQVADICSTSQVTAGVSADVPGVPSGGWPAPGYGAEGGRGRPRSLFLENLQNQIVNNFVPFISDINRHHGYCVHLKEWDLPS